jgi:hypothetical protein
MSHERRRSAEQRRCPGIGEELKVAIKVHESCQLAGALGQRFRFRELVKQSPNKKKLSLTVTSQDKEKTFKRIRKKATTNTLVS